MKCEFEGPLHPFTVGGSGPMHYFVFGLVWGMAIALVIVMFLAHADPLVTVAGVTADLTHHDELYRTQHAVATLEDLRYLPGQLGPLYAPPTVVMVYRSDQLYCSGFGP